MTTTNMRFVAKNGLDNNANSISNLGVSGASLTLSGANALTLTTTGTTNVTLPTSGTLLTTTGNAATATSIASGAANQIAYQTGSGTTSFISAPTTSSTFLEWNGSAFIWAAAGGFSTTDDTTTNATYYPTFVTTAGGSTAKTSSTTFTFNPSTGTLSATVLNTLSDRRAKTNIRPLGYGLADILALSGYKYEMVNGGQTSIGVIAQEVQALIPESVSPSVDGMLGVNYPSLTAVLIEAVKQLSARIDILENAAKQV